MTILNLPENFPVHSFSFQLETNTRQSVSPFNRVTQTKELAGPRWKTKIKLITSKRDVVAETKAFLLKLRGGAGRFWFYDFAGKTAMGTASGLPVINGAGQTGRSLNTGGWTANETVLKAGDYFQLGSELKMVTDDVTSDGSGDAVVNFEPPVRTSPADGEALIVEQASCVMRLEDDNQVTWQVDEAGFYSMSFEAVEVFE